MKAFSNLAKTNNTVVLPANVGDAGSMVAQVRAFLLVLFIDNCYKGSTSGSKLMGFLSNLRAGTHYKCCVARVFRPRGDLKRRNARA